MPPFISPESVKELNEVMCVTKDNWTPHLYRCIAPTAEHCFTDIEMMRGKSSMSAKGAEP